MVSPNAQGLGFLLFNGVACYFIHPILEFIFALQLLNTCQSMCGIHVIDFPKSHLQQLIHVYDKFSEAL